MCLEEHFYLYFFEQMSLLNQKDKIGHFIFLIAFNNHYLSSYMQRK